MKMTLELIQGTGRLSPAKDLANFRAAKKIALEIETMTYRRAGAENPFLGANFGTYGNVVVWLTTDSTMTKAVPQGMLIVDGVKYYYRQVEPFTIMIAK